MSKLESLKMGAGLPGQKNRTRESLRKDILIGLGAPIIKIELTNEQLDNAINSALRIFWMYHRDGSFENYYTYVLTKEDAQRGWIRIPETIDSVSNVVYFGKTGYPSNRIYEGDMSTEVLIEKEYYENNPIPPNPIPAENSINGGYNFGTIPYQERMIAGYQINGTGTPYQYTINGIASSNNGSYSNGSLHITPGAFNQMSYADYFERQQNFQNFQSMMGNGPNDGKCFKYARYQRRLYLYFPFSENDGICLKCFENVDPDLNPEFGEVFDDETVKNLSQALAKQTWGSILRKYGNVALVGGVTLDGQQIYEEASQEFDDIMSKLINEQPIPFLVG